MLACAEMRQNKDFLHMFQGRVATVFIGGEIYYNCLVTYIAGEANTEHYENQSVLMELLKK